MSFTRTKPVLKLAYATFGLAIVASSYGQSLTGKYAPAAGEDPNTILRIELEQLSWQGSDVGSTNYADFEGTVQVAIVTSDGDIIGAQTLKAFNGEGINPGSETFSPERKITYYCAMGNIKASGKVVLWGSIVEKDDGPNPGFGKDSDDKLSGNCGPTDGPSISIRALSAGQSQSLSRTWTGSNDNAGMGGGISTAFRIDAKVKVKRVSFSDVPSEKRATVGCADASATFTLRHDGNTVLVECNSADFGGEYAPLCGKFKGSYSGSTSNGFSKGNLWITVNGESITFIDQSAGKNYSFEKQGGGSGSTDIFATGGGPAAIMGDWYWPDEPVQSLKISEGVAGPLSVWIGGKANDFEADGVSATGKAMYKQIGGSGVQIQSGKDNIYLIQGGVKTKLFRAPPAPGQKRSGGGASTGAEIFTYIREGNMDAVQEVISDTPDMVNTKNAAGQAPMHAAVTSGNVEMVQALAGAGGDVNTPLTDGRTPLMMAVSQDNVAMVSVLLEANANVHAVAADGKTPLSMAVGKDNTAIAEALLDKGATVTPQVLEQAVMTNKTSMIDIFLQKGTTADQVLAMAEEKNKIDIFRSMVENNGATVTNELFDKSVAAKRIPFADYMLDKDIDMNRAMATSIGAGNKPLVEKCLMKGATPGPALAFAVDRADLPLATACVTSYGADPNGVMPQAVVKGSVPIVTMLLDNNADATLGLQAAVDNGSLPMATLLLDRGADATAQMPNACGRGNDAIVQVMIAKGGDPNAGMKAAVDADKASTVQLLVTAGADPAPAVSYAVEKGNAPLLDLLVSKGGDATAPEYMAKAAGRGDVPVLNVLLNKANADPNPGMLPAVTNQGAGVLDLLLKKGADATPPALISKSVERGDPAMTTMLLDKGADANNATLMAINVNRPDLVTLLQSRGGDLSKTGFVAASAKHNNPALTAMLLDAGAPAQEGVGPAVGANAGAVLDLLHSKGADVTDQSLMVTAVNNGFEPVAAVLVKGGCDARGYIDPNTGGNLLHVAAQREDFPVLRILVDAKYDVNLKATGTGDTPLHVAARGGKDNLDAVMALVDAGADVNAMNGRGKSVVQEAKGPRVRKYIKENGGERKPGN